MKTTRDGLILLIAALLVAAAFAASAAASGSAPKQPPCTKKALSAGLKRGSAQPKSAKVQGSFGCAGGWAYSGIVVGGKHGFDAVAVYKAKNGVWVAVNRAKPCRTHAIPKKIYKGACTTS
ncbi:MAG: hypothetical protein JOZ07_05330 [Solirubrobacterales bacterium]|nr:hypothetical protein [Solirubrobacterales bacterium]